MDHTLFTRPDGTRCVKVRHSDYGLLMHPLLNKGMSFPAAERDAFNLWGLLPPSFSTLELQRQRSYDTCMGKVSAVEQYIYLRDLQDSNETLFYSLLSQHIDTVLPIVYTPTVGLGCQRYSHIYRRPRGVFLAYPQRAHIDRILANPRFDHVKVMVVSDGERILGLGDQGAGGMGISIGKLALYSACAGIYPGFTLPILLDVGTDNPELLNDPLYIGWQHPRIRGKEYADFIEQFVVAVKKRFPHVLLQWEDFARENAGTLLTRYQQRICSFNDDIQGTAAIAAAALLAATQVTKIPLIEQRIVVLGAGSAGCGISRLLCKMMEEMGLSSTAARQRFYLVDRDGLLLNGQTDLLDFQSPFARDAAEVAHWQLTQPTRIDLFDVIRNVKPHALLGVSGQGGIFTEACIRAMAAGVARPIIFPLSNPDSRAEARPIDICRWTEGRAIIGSGSPFPPITLPNGVTCHVDQTNNCYVFPGLGLALIALQARSVTDALFIAAARALAQCSPARFDDTGALLPPLANIRAVSLKVAIAVGKEILAAGLADRAPPADLDSYLADFMWMPEYLPYEKM